MKQHCKQFLIDYLRRNQGFHAKVDLYSVARDWSPETCGRKLREAEEEGSVKVEYYDSKYSKNLAKYCIADYTPPKPKVEILEREDGSRIALLVN